MSAVAVELGWSSPDEPFICTVYAFDDLNAAQAWIDALPGPYESDNWTAVSVLQPPAPTSASYQEAGD